MYNNKYGPANTEKLFGNSLEVEEAVNALKGYMEEDVKQIVLEISSYILKLAGFGENLDENKKRVIENIENGLAYKKFIELVEGQNGDIDYLENIPKAKYIVPVKSEKSGYVNLLDAKKCGEISLSLGARKNEKRR